MEIREQDARRFALPRHAPCLALLTQAPAISAGQVEGDGLALRP